MDATYILPGVAIIFLAYILLGEEIRFYRLMIDKNKYWNECFPRFLSRAKRNIFKFALGIVLLACWIYFLYIA